ncbi:EscU/YscU/HrcU family type III secretion system export apparatus switch protein [Cytobacillus sp. FSL W7-1323]|uniref:Type III secretion system protein n=1 Tax=Cytobacillus kochii TaxID=859143 RepID=A0A248TCU5_9BACI|nr:MULTISPECIES: EscU/YscU/HrcU family type III secretion system export apparatus switch protein [Cytobacillus]ASV65969.1 type III secretion system protein [Cytobacillus kochii]MDQ0184843.1 flagellar biosynthesis protein [Cytobacillus kochii]MEA1851943.1 EscU/YscU/HrcU family type III secretion system export apparatus switch protein [Cytobacillus sp. OWB-43]MED1606472.1 EscU/YscU/HrcU family type III secretion system export apparatus switch protein [Cytobacillus kochii]
MNGQNAKQAVALTYSEKMDAPVVSAKGKGLIAENIITVAQQHELPIQEDPSLVELLGKLNMNEKIPEELYQVVAEVFAFIYQVDRKAKDKEVRNNGVRSLNQQ